MVSLFQEGIAAAPLSPVESAESTEPIEYELVLGKRQIASVMFVAIAAVVIFSAAAYVAGKAIGQRRVVATQPTPSAVHAPAPVPAIPVVEATIVRTKELPPSSPAVKQPAPAVPSELDPQAPLFADPVPQAVYIQVGALEKGIAVVVAEGLRTHGFPSFVAPGPSEKVFRVLVGPFPNEEAYRRAKAAIDDLGLASFSRRYQQ